jgi:glycosyltransferase involved in cell wall biosynthesis
MKTLLVDLTSLDTPSRLRGQGRYVRELAISLSRLPASALGGIRLLALTHLGLDGSHRVEEDLAAFAGSPELAVPAPADHYRVAYARRLALWYATRRIGADAVHLGVSPCTPLLMSLTPCRRIVTCHDTIPSRFPEHYMTARDGGSIVGKALERRRYRSADLVVAVSDATRRDVANLYGVPESRIRRVYNGVDIERWAAPPRLEADEVLGRFGLRGKRFALYVGGYHWHKNLEGMVGGIARARALGSDVELVWAGHLPEAHVALIEGAARSAGVADAVRRIGFVSDDEIAVLYRAAVAHTLVSRAEGFGLTVVEAMASGCPVVTTAGGSLAEVAGDAAITVAPDDHDAIGGALLRLVQEPSLARALSEKGRARAPRFSLSIQAEGMARVYRTFLGV